MRAFLIHRHFFLSTAVITVFITGLQAGSIFDVLKGTVDAAVPPINAATTEADLFHIPTKRSVISLENADKAPSAFRNTNTSELDTPSLSSLNKECTLMSLPQLVAIIRAGKAKELSAACYENLAPQLFEYLPAVLLNEIFKQHPDLVFKYTKSPSIFQHINSSLPQLPVVRGDVHTGKNGFFSSGTGDSLELCSNIRPMQFGHVNNLYSVDWDCLAKIFDGNKCMDLTPDFFTPGSFPNLAYFNYTANFKPDVVASYRLGDSIASGHFNSTTTKEQFQTTVEIVITKISQACFDKMNNATQHYLTSRYRKHLSQRIQREHKLLEINTPKPMPKPAPISSGTVLSSDELVQHDDASSMVSCVHAVLMTTTFVALVCCC